MGAVHSLKYYLLQCCVSNRFTKGNEKFIIPPCQFTNTDNVAPIEQIVLNEIGKMTANIYMMRYYIITKPHSSKILTIQNFSHNFCFYF